MKLQAAFIEKQGFDFVIVMVDESVTGDGEQADKFKDTLRGLKLFRDLPIALASREGEQLRCVSDSEEILEFLNDNSLEEERWISVDVDDQGSPS